MSDHTHTMSEHPHYMTDDTHCISYNPPYMRDTLKQMSNNVITINYKKFPGNRCEENNMLRQTP